MNSPPITITDTDLQRLAQLIINYDAEKTEQLDVELARAEVVPQHEIGRDVVTMNSDVVYEDTSTGEHRQVRIVFPKDADAERGWISVLAPLGSALLGLRVGQTINWQVPSRTRHLRVVDVPYQPEASGDYTL